MLNFVKTAFRELVEILLWVILAGCAVAGYMIGSSGHSDGGGVIGVVIGVVVGLLVCVLVGGYLATLLEMGKDLAVIKAAVTKTDTPDPVLTASSVLLNSGKPVSGNLTRENKRNLFHVELAQPGKLSINVTTDEEDGLPHWTSSVKVVDAGGKNISASGRFEFPYSVEVDIPKAGTYVIEITSSNAGRYYLTAQY